MREHRQRLEQGTYRIGRTVAARTAGVGAAALAAAIGLAGCGSGGGSGAAAGSHSAGVATSTSPSAGASNSDSGSAASMADPTAALQAWVTNVIEGNYSQACLESTGMPTGSATSSTAAPSAAVCADPTKIIADGQSIASALSRLRTLFTPAGAESGSPDVQVTPIKASGNSVTYDARGITVDGQELDKIVVAHSSGVTAQQLDLTFPMTEINGSWYVANFNLQIG